MSGVAGPSIRPDSLKGPPEKVAGPGVVVALGRGVAAGVDAYENEVEARAEEVGEGVQPDIVVRTSDGAHLNLTVF